MARYRLESGAAVARLAAKAGGLTLRPPDRRRRCLAGLSVASIVRTVVHAAGRRCSAFVSGMASTTPSLGVAGSPAAIVWRRVQPADCRSCVAGFSTVTIVRDRLKQPVDHVVWFPDYLVVRRNQRACGTPLLLFHVHLPNLSSLLSNPVNIVSVANEYR